MKRKKNIDELKFAILWDHYLSFHVSLLSGKVCRGIIHYVKLCIRINSTIVKIQIQEGWQEAIYPHSNE